MIDTYPVILDRRDTTLTLKNNQLIVRHEGGRESLPLKLINLIIIATPIQATTTLWQQLNQHGITTVVLPTRGRGAPVWLTGGLTASLELRQRQYHFAHQPETLNRLAWYWIEKKLHNQRFTLQQLDAPLGPLETIQPPATFHYDTLLGLEGTAARHYFQQLAQFLPEAWRFRKRTRNPPRDPFNALLSLSYTLLTTEALHIVQATGFDPWLGFLHRPYPGRPALALDLIEPFRPQIDLWCLHLANEILDPTEHFQQDRKDQPATHLNKAGRNLYFRHWAIDRQNWREDKSLMQNLLQTLRDFTEQLHQLETTPPPPTDPDVPF